MASTPDTSSCTLDTCPVELSTIGYVPNLGGNVFIVVWFGIMLVAQLAMSVRYRTWSWLAGQVLGLVLEIIGYAARVRLHDNPFDEDQFKIYIITVTIAPAFLCYTIYLCFGRVVIVYGPKLSLIHFRAYTIIFVTMDVICLVLQAGGAGWTQAEDISPSDLDKALQVLRAGLGMQVASLSVFVFLSLDLFVRIMRHRDQWSTSYVEVRDTKIWKAFLPTVFVAALLILARSAFRIEELKDGFNPPDDDAETLFMVFEGAFIGLATLLLVLAHPGPVFGASWKATSFFSKQKNGPNRWDADRNGESGQELRENGSETRADGDAQRKASGGEPRSEPAW